jgi:hypothetical protein
MFISVKDPKKVPMYQTMTEMSTRLIREKVLTGADRLGFGGFFAKQRGYRC